MFSSIINSIDNYRVLPISEAEITGAEGGHLQIKEINIQNESNLIIEDIKQRTDNGSEITIAKKITATIYYIGDGVQVDPVISFIRGQNSPCNIIIHLGNGRGAFSNQGKSRITIPDAHITHKAETQQGFYRQIITATKIFLQDNIATNI